MELGKYIICLLGVAVFGFIGYRAVMVIEKSGIYISTNGLSDRIVKSDYAKWKISIINETDSLKDVQAKRKSDKKVVMDFVKKCGFKGEEIIECGTAIEDQLRWQEKTEGKKKYSVKDNIIVQTSQVDLVDKSMVEISQLIDQDLRIDDHVSYLYKDFDKLRIEMLEEAAKDSKNRAEHIAKTNRRKITEMRNFSTGRFSIFAEDTSVDSDRDWDSENSIMKRVRVVVSASYDMK
jgi:hypothetical protein